MSLDDLITNKDFFSAFINQINCPLIYISEKGVIEAANDFSLKVLQLGSNPCVGINIDAFCQQHGYLLANLFRKNGKTPKSLEETYKVNEKQYTILWKIMSLPDFDGLNNGSFLIGYDKTEYNLLSEKLENITFFYENILSKLPTNVYWKDRNSVYMGCNERLANVMGLPSREAVKGMTDFDFSWSKPAAESFVVFDQKVMRSETALTTEDSFEEADGRIVTVLTNKTPLKNKAGETVGVLAISVDITELKETQAQLELQKQKSEVANNAKSEFIANMSHDLRTPMTGVSGMLDGMAFAARDAQAVLTANNPKKYKTALTELVTRTQEYTAVAKESTNELINLFNEILEAIQLESGKIHAESQAFDMRACVKRSIDIFRPVATHKALDLSMMISDDVPPYLQGLRTYLDRILSNLISNALKFTKDGSVTVNVTLSENPLPKNAPNDSVMVSIQVKDTGIGIPQDKYEEIFGHFSRLTSSYQGIYKGAGLGLYAVKQYLEAMQGSVEVDSDVGKGTCFTVCLPLVITDHVDNSATETATSAASLAVAKPISIDQSDSTEAPQASVLLVEDSTPAIMVGKLLLNKLHCAVDVATSGSEAVNKAKNGDYDLILMDVGLPDFDGIEATRQIRALTDKKKSRVPIVAVTGHASNPDKRQECFDAGMQEVLSKPAQSLSLESMLQRFVFDGEKAEVIETQAEAEKALAVIDWEGCLQTYQGNAETARELLSLMVEELKKTKEILDKAYAEKDTQALRFECHRVRGALAYVKLPQLTEALKAFHEAVKEVPQDFEKLEKMYVDLQEAMTVFWKTWEAEDF